MVASSMRPLSVQSTSFSPRWLKNVSLLALSLLASSFSYSQVILTPSVATASRDCLFLDVVSDSRGLLPIAYSADSAGWVASLPDDRFSVQVTNRCAARIMFSLVVDGLDAIDGKTQGFGPAGYVVEAYGSRKVPGWRTSLQDVARFYFTDEQNGYRKQKTGTSADYGFISIAVFNENARSSPFIVFPGPLTAPSSSSDSRAPASSAPSSQSGASRSLPSLRDNPAFNGPRGQDLFSNQGSYSQSDFSNNAQTAATAASAVGFGSIAASPVSIADFIPDSTAPAFILTVRYVSQAELIKKNLSPVSPRSFPAIAPDASFFATPP